MRMERRFVRKAKNGMFLNEGLYERCNLKTEGFIPTA